MKIKAKELLTASQKLQFEMATLFAKYYKQQISENVKKALANKKLEKEKLSTLAVNQSKTK
jgi:DNA invertase Pin-like site-specific DNA recombinase